MTKSFNRVVAIALAAGISLSGSAVAMAQQESVDSAQNNISTANPGLIDQSVQGSLTIHKKADPADTGDPTGETDATVQGTDLDGVGFTVYKVADLKTNADLVAAAKLTPETAQKGQLEQVGTDETRDGKVVFSNLKPGVYLVKETGPLPGYTPAAPFLAFVPMTSGNKETGGTSWNYNVVAYPKNYPEEDPTKEVVDSGINVGGEITYTITTTAQRIDKERGQKRTLYRIEDTIDRATTTTASKVSIAGTTADGGTIDFQAEDYKVTVDGQKVTITLTATGLDKLGNGDKVIATIKADVTSLPEHGKVINTARQFENDPNSDQEKTPKDTPEVETHYGGVKFKKVGPDRKALTGAEFQVYGTTKEGQCAEAVNDENNLQTILGTNTWTSNGEGNVVIDGLHINDYADGSANKNNKYLAYCLVESKSPKGFELLAQPLEFKLTAAGQQLNLTLGDNEGEIVNLPDTTPKLPDTGGIGIALFVVAGIIALAATAVQARRKANA